MKHGTRSTYRRKKCRCDLCKLAENRYQQERYAARRQSRNVAAGLVDGGRLRLPPGTEGATRLDDPPVLTVLRSPVAYRCDTCGTGFADRRTFTTHHCTGDAA